ncbi:MAG: hypothetical protein ABSC77_08965 [Terracidiphilus sp.]|jgi:hypothetical protein
MKILPIFLLLIAATGCCQPYQRFIPAQDGVALDTKTGRYCYPGPKNNPTTLPLCYDLYKEEK